MKRFISALFCFLFAVVLSVSAFAEGEIPVSLGTATVGSALQGTIISGETVYEGTAQYSVESGTVPPGCGVSLIDGRLVLSGSPSEAGDYSFTVPVSDSAHNDRYACGITIVNPEAQAPQVIINHSQSSCYIGDSLQLSINASVSDGGTLSYQWYLNNSPVTDATGTTIMVDSSSAGTLMYYCTVTNTLNGSSTSTTSSTIQVTVSEPTITGISVKSMPTKTTYKVGDTLDTAGFELNAVYSGGQTRTITSGYSVSPTLLTSEGTKTIVVSYLGQTCTFNITVEKAKDTRELTVVTLPTKTTYKVGERLDTTGIRIRITDGSNYTDVTSGFTCSPTTLSTVGPQTITVAYDGITGTYTVNVLQAEDDKLTVKTMPTKTEYTVGDQLDVSGLTLEKQSGTTTTQITSGFTYNPTTLTKVGTQTITVTYEKLTCTFTVTVNAKEAEASPSPEVSAVPTSGAGTDSSSGSSHGHSGLIVFIVVVAVLALAALGAYVYIARIDNFDESPLGRFLNKLTDRKK